MRIIHTPNWHLDQSFFTKNRADEHEAFLTWLVSQVDEHQVDALIVAGDVFDTGTPPSYARELFNRFVVALQPTGWWRWRAIMTRSRRSMNPARCWPA